MRPAPFCLAAAAALLIAAGAAAQVTLGVAKSPGITFHPASPPVTRAPAIPPSPPPGRHDRAPIAKPGGTSPGDLFLAGPHTYAPRYDRRSRFHPRLFVSPYAVPVPYFLPGDYPIALASPIATDPSPVEYVTSVGGYLALRMEPRTAQVYIDGFFAGSADDVRGPGYLLEPGPHHIELTAEGFETAAFDVRIRANDTITYTRDLERPAPPAPKRETAIAFGQPATAKTLYVIPRCYAGDRPPAVDQLPERCRMEKLLVIK